MAKVAIKGAIVGNDEKWIYDWWEYEAVCPKDVVDVISGSGGELLEVEINSGGGDIFAAAEIYAAIRGYLGPVDINIVGLCASAASVIAMSGKSRMNPMSLMMVHNVSVSGVSGDRHDMERAVEMLKSANQSIANAYMAKTGMTAAEALDMMDTTTWLTAQLAKEKGLIDEIAFIDDMSNLQLTNDFGGMLSREMIEKAKAERSNKQTLNNSEKLEELKNQLLNDIDLI